MASMAVAIVCVCACVCVCVGCVLCQVLDECLKEIAAALLQADVNVRYVAQLRNNIKRTVQLEEAAMGTNKRKLIQKVSSQHT